MTRLPRNCPPDWLPYRRQILATLPQDDDGRDWSAVRRDLRRIALAPGCEACTDYKGADQVPLCDDCRAVEEGSAR